MVKVIWTRRALNDLEEIGDYISKDSFQYARLTLSKLVDTDLLLSENPMIGRTVPELNDKSIREIIKGSYRIIYQMKNSNCVEILTVFHSSRLLNEKDF
ncbi:MAG: type II toxin-antitoxin system RelE/ParE family toxin [Ignavibacteriae bacterium]|nr:type II toxin-antitoxin system RelE/ParE family toxin [Ignavibacteriota bacterium]